MPGDVLVVHIKKLTLNRDWAESDDGLDERALNSDLAVKVKENGKSIVGISTEQRELQLPKPLQNTSSTTRSRWILRRKHGFQRN